MKNLLAINLLVFLFQFLIFNFLPAQTLPRLPSTCEIKTEFPDLKSYVIKTVGPVNRDYNNLQKAIDEALSGTILILDAGIEFKGSFRLPYKQGNDWIIITSSDYSQLPVHKRVQINDRTKMSKIITTDPSGLPTFYTEHQAHHYRLVGLEITVDTSVRNSYGLVMLGNGYNSTRQSELSQQPFQIILDRCYIHGHTNANIMKFGVRLDGKELAVIDSYISDFHSIGFDAQAIAGINGTGPFKIINNYLEASGENILFGGAAPDIKGLVPSNIEIKNNHLFKPFSWKINDQNYIGNHWTIKNLFELKTGTKVLFEGNILENSWADLPIGQSGYAILLTVRNENGLSPQADISDITIRNNIIRRCGAGISISGNDDNTFSSHQSSRILIENNLWDQIDGDLYGDHNIYGPNDGVLLKQGSPIDVILNHNTVFQSGAITWLHDTCSSFKLTNNIFNCYLSKGSYQGIYGPGLAKGGTKVINRYLPHLTDEALNFNLNVFISGDSLNYPNFNTKSRNYFPLNPNQVDFKNYSQGIADYNNYKLNPTSPFYQYASDGKDIGVVFELLNNTLHTVTYDCKVSNFSENNKISNIHYSIINNKITLQSNDEESYHVYLIDINGKIIISTNFMNIFEIDLPEVLGSYFLHIRTRKLVLIKNIINY